MFLKASLCLKVYLVYNFLIFFYISININLHIFIIRNIVNIKRYTKQVKTNEVK